MPRVIPKVLFLLVGAGCKGPATPAPVTPAPTPDLSELSALLDEGVDLVEATGDFLCRCPEFIESPPGLDEAECLELFAPPTPTQRSCELDAWGLDVPGSTAYLACTTDERRVLVDCLDAAGCADRVPCQVAFEQAVNACPDVPPDVDTAVQACY